jgi:hypothetical protein
MQGEEWPDGRAVFQTTFSVGENFSGKFISSGATPEPAGPRKRGQRAALSAASHRASKQRQIKRMEEVTIKAMIRNVEYLRCIRGKSEIPWRAACQEGEATS